MLRAAALRPINVTMLVIGAGAFAITLAWWLPPLTILTYASLVFLAARDPIFQRKVLRGGEVPKTSPNAAVKPASSANRTRRSSSYSCSRLIVSSRFRGRSGC